MSDVVTRGEIDGLNSLVISRGGWQDSYASVMQAEGLDCLSIRVYDQDLGFLANLPWLRGLVLNAYEARDLRSIESLRELKTLTLNISPRPKVTLDLSRLPELKTLRLRWNAGLESLFTQVHLVELRMDGPPDLDFGRLGDLRSLRRLEIGSGQRLATTKGVEKLQELRFLGLYHQTSLTKLEGVTELGDLEHLDLDTCRRLGQLDAVSNLSRVTTLKVANCGEIESLEPLRHLVSLQSFWAWESTNILDGDLSVLLDLPQLQQIALRSRKHYRPSVEDVESALAVRHG